MSEFKSWVVAVTGGTRGIGRAVTDLFHQKGHTVAACSRTPREASLPADILHVQADVRRRPEMERFLQAVMERHGRIDILINGAGASQWRPIEAVDEAFVSEVMETNILGTLWGCAAASLRMGSGACIINLSSLAGKRGSANNSVYCAAKFAVNGITQALAKELGPRGIRVNAVCPVYVRTEKILEALSAPASPAGGLGVEPYLKSFAATQTALGRLPSAREVAEVVFFLAGPGASAITGQCINVDCGAFPQ